MIRTGKKLAMRKRSRPQNLLQVRKYFGEQRYIGILEVATGEEGAELKEVTLQGEIEDEINDFYSKLMQREKPTHPKMTSETSWEKQAMACSRTV